MVEEVAGRRRGWRWLSRRRLLAIVLAAVVLAAVVTWVVVPYVQEQFKYEQLTLHNYWWTRNSVGDISMVTLRLHNNGTKTIRMNTIHINQTETNSSEWGTNSRALPPNFWCWMYVASQLMVFEEDAVYNLTIGTEAGGSFSYVVKVEEEDVFQEEFNIQSVDFTDWRYWGDPLFVDVCVENHHHTVYVVVTERWINGSLFDSEKFWIKPNTVGGEALCIHFIFNWTRAATYTFTLRTACGNTYNYTKTAPD